MLEAAPPWVIAIVAVVFGCIGFLSIQLAAYVCRTIVPFEDGPKPGRPPSIALVVGAACVGGVLASQIGLGMALLVPAIVVAALVASWYSDVLCGIIPDYFTLVPLAIIVVLRALKGDWTDLIVTAIVTACFALAALFSKGRGMGWGDVKLVALGAVVLGDRSLLAFSAACLAAVVVAAVRRRRTEPMAFAPYLASAIALALAVPIFPPTAI
jgi:leader peptidase (prepilin peptidase)/N-methyltransferase